MKYFLLVAAVAFFAVGSHARTLTNEEKEAELRQVTSLVKSQYGPYEYKLKELKIDVDALLNCYIEESKPLDNLGFYYLVNRFVAEFQDSHFSSRLQTKHVTLLGFYADRVDGKVVIESVHRGVLSPIDFPFDRGDQILEFGGKPVDDAVAELKQYVGSGNPETALRMATMLLSYRPSTTVPPQKGKVEVKVLSQLSGLETTVELEWQDNGEILEEVQGNWAGSSHLASKIDYLNLSVDDAFSHLPKTERAYRCSGLTRIAPPPGTVVISVTPFVAYYHPTPKGNIGYLRIPHYSWQNPLTGADESDLRFKQYEFVVHQLEQNTVGLIIDQDHNCGGSVVFLEKMVSLFSEKPFEALQFEFLASRTEYLTFKSWLDEESKLTLEGLAISEVLDLMKTAWQAGQKLTPRTSFHSKQLVSPNSVRYTKPIVLLADEMSGSGGDAFPAMLQGLGRAKVMGSRTMGAGGHVVPVEPLFYSGNNIRLTKSLFYHPNGMAIENHGVTPDYPYTIQLEDYTDGYLLYQQEYLKKLSEELPDPPKP